MDLAQVFEDLKKFNPSFTTFSLLSKVSECGGEIEVEILNEDPDYNERDECYVVWTFNYDADTKVVDGGIGHYEFWGAKGCDSHMQNEVQSVTLTDEWPEELKWLASRIEERICDAIEELEPDTTPDWDGDYWGD